MVYQAYSLASHLTRLTDQITTNNAEQCSLHTLLPVLVAWGPTFIYYKMFVLIKNHLILQKIGWYTASITPHHSSQKYEQSTASKKRISDEKYGVAQNLFTSYVSDQIFWLYVSLYSWILYLKSSLSIHVTSYTLWLMMNIAN